MTGAEGLKPSSRYLVRHPALKTFLRARDAWWDMRVRRNPPSPAAEHRIALSVGGHLGDAVIATAVLPALRQGIPHAAIGVVCSSMQRMVFEGHPLVAKIHVADHWFTSRGPGSRVLRLPMSIQNDRALVRELRLCDYDVSIDLYPYYPNRAHHFFEAGVARRVGYDSGGGRPLLTDPVGWTDARVHTVEQHASLLKHWKPDLRTTALHYDLPAIAPKDADAGEALLHASGVENTQFLVLHPGTGNAAKLWPMARWSELIATLLELVPARQLVMTGAGAEDRAVVESLVATHAGVISLCDRTTWGSFRYVIARAAGVIGGDSVATHVSAAHGVPSVTIMSAVSDSTHWRPLGSRARVVGDGTPGPEVIRALEAAMEEQQR